MLTEATRELEARIVASVVVWGKKALDELTLITSDDFASPALRDVFVAALQLEHEGSEVSLPTVYTQLGDNKAARDAANDPGAEPALPGLLRPLAQKLRTAATLRRIVAAGREVAALPTMNGRSPEEQLSEALRIARRMLNGATDTIAPTISFEEIADAECDRLERIRKGEPPPLRVRTGLSAVDAITGGFEPGSMVVIAGETSSGKSALCGQVAASEARNGRPVAFITSEMTHRQMLARIVSGLSRRPIGTLLDPRQAADADAGRLYAEHRSLPIFFQRIFPPNLQQASTAIRFLATTKGAKLAVIDYAQRLAAVDDDRQEQAIAAIAHEAKNLALELGIVVLMAAQLNRGVSHRTDPRPKLSDLRGSGRLEQDADAVLFVYQPSRHGRSGSPEIIVAKNRNGPHGVVPVSFRGDVCWFEGAANQNPVSFRFAENDSRK